MYCPKCKSEFQEGYDHCHKCDEDLVESLEETEVEANNNSESRIKYFRFLNWRIEKWLKVGGVIIIILSVDI